MVRIASLVGILGALAAAFASQAVGVQADMVGQGLSYRILTPGGFGAEIVGRGWMDSDDDEYSFGGELRLLKFFNPSSRIHVFTGIAAGAWQKQDFWIVDTNYEDTLPGDSAWFKQTGFSSVALIGLEIVLARFGERAGISVTPEFQFGYYTMPQYYYPLDERYPPDQPQPVRMISPGAGIGLRFFF